MSPKALTVLNSLYFSHPDFLFSNSLSPSPHQISPPNLFFSLISSFNTDPFTVEKSFLLLVTFGEDFVSSGHHFTQMVTEVFPILLHRFFFCQFKITLLKCFNRKLKFHLRKNFKTAQIKVWKGLSSVRQKVLSSLQEWALIKRNFKEKVSTL